MNARMATEFLRSKINRSEEIADFIEQQERWAELGKLAALDQDDCGCNMCDNCCFKRFCDRLAELKGGGLFDNGI